MSNSSSFDPLDERVRSALQGCDLPRPVDADRLDARLLADFDALLGEREAASQVPLKVVRGAAGPVDKSMTGAGRSAGRGSSRSSRWSPFVSPLAGLALAASVAVLSLGVLLALPAEHQPSWFEDSLVAQWAQPDDSFVTEADLSEVDPLALMAFDLL